MFEIVVLTILFAIVIIYLRSINSELFSLSLIAGGIIILGVAIDYIGQTFDFFNVLINKIGLDSKLVSVILKITVIGYLVDFGAGIVEDLGLKSLADKLVFVGKISILISSFPIFYAIFNLISELL